MKKNLIFLLISIFVTISSLSYVNFGLLKDSAVEASIDSKDIDVKVLNEDAVAYAPSNIESISVSNDQSKISFISNDLLYIFDMVSLKTIPLNRDSFAKDAAFIDDSQLLVISDELNGIQLSIYNLEMQTEEVIGNLSYSYFKELKNVVSYNGSLFFDIVYNKNGDDNFRSYEYKNSNINSTYKSSIINVEYVNENVIYTDRDNITFINGRPFSYNDTEQYSLIGVDNDNVVYLQNEIEQNKIISLMIDDSIDVLENIDFSIPDGAKIICTDKLYILGTNYVLDINDGIKVAFDESINILNVYNGFIYYLYNNGIYTQKI